MSGEFLMGWFGPQTGAGNGQKEWKAQTRRGTGSNWDQENKDRKAIIKAEKKEAARIRKLEKKAEGKSSFFY